MTKSPGKVRIALVADSISAKPTGVGRYAQNVYGGLESKGQDLLPIHYDAKILKGLGADKGIFLPPLFGSSEWPIGTSLLWHFFLMRRLRSWEDHFDLVFDPSQFLHPLGLIHKPFVYVIHDMSFMGHPECHRRGKRFLFRLLLTHTLSKADRIVCDSDYTRKELRRYFSVEESRILVARGAADSCFRPVEDPQDLHRVRMRYVLPERFILYVGTIEPRKNLDQLLRAYSLMGKTIPWPLCIAGKVGWRVSSLFEMHSRLDLRDRVHFLGYVPEDDLPVLYNLAKAFVYVSKEEGFGLPPLEAMQCGTPVVVSHAGSLPEIVGGAALMVDPDDPNAMGEALKRMCEDPSLREELREKGLVRASLFSWDKTVEDLLALFQDLVQVRGECKQSMRGQAPR